MKTNKIHNSIILWVILLVGVSAGCKKNEPELLSEAITVETKSAAIDSLNAIYIDPSATVNGTGTKASPLNGSTFANQYGQPWQDKKTYLFKRGTTWNLKYRLWLQNISVTLGAYGSGNKPILRYDGADDCVMSLSYTNNSTFQGIEFFNNNITGVAWTAMYATNITVDDCKFHGGEWCFRYDSGKKLKLLNSEIYHSDDDAVFIKNTDSVEVGNTHIYDVNRKWFVNTDPLYCAGDVLQLVNVNYANIHDNILDHSGTGNKFCLIINSETSGFDAHGIIERNQLIRDPSGDVLLYLEWASNFIIRDNKFIGSQIAIYNKSSNPKVYHNLFCNTTDKCFYGQNVNPSNTQIVNNTFYNVNKVISSYGESILFKNNIVYQCTGQVFEGSTNIAADYNDYYLSDNKGITNLGSSSISLNPGFKDITKQDFTLLSSSPCIDKGTNILGSSFDLSGTVCPVGSSIDIGAYEYSTGSQVQPPTSSVAPVVNLTSPTSGQTFSSPASVQLTASATDADGTVTKVEFFNGATKLGESTTAPYSYTWTNVASGTFNLTAIATDNSNTKATSKTVTVTVSASSNTAPVVSLTSPWNGQNFTAPAVVQITANATDADGKISKVEFYNGTVKLGESSTSPYSFTWSNVPFGSYNITAVATDNLGAKTTSIISNIYVNNSAIVNKPPVVSLTSPWNGQNYKAPAKVVIAASASDTDGTISKVEFYKGSVKLGEITKAPYTFTWKNAPFGAYNVTAVATDNSGAKTTSKQAVIYIN